MLDMRSGPILAHTSGSGDGDPRPALAATVGPLLPSRPRADESGPSTASEAIECLQAIARLGYRGVQWPATVAGLRPRDLDSSARRGVRAELARAELACAGVDVWIPPGHFLDPSTVDRAIAALEASIGLAADLASGPRRPVVCTLLPSPAERLEAAAAGRELDDAVAGLAALCEREGIAMADHAVTPSAPLARGLDPVLAFAASRDPIALALAGGEPLRSVRVADLLRSGQRGPVGEPGESRLDVVGLRAALDVVGFADMPVADARQWHDPLGGLRATIERWCGGSVGRPPARKGRD